MTPATTVDRRRPPAAIAGRPSAAAETRRPAAGDPHGGAVTFARAWAKAITGTSYLPVTQAELETFLTGLTRQLADGLSAEPLKASCGYQIGANLVGAHLTSAEGLGRTIEVINLRLLRDLGLAGEDMHDRMARMLGTIATGYASALRRRTLAEQESIRRAALLAGEQAERALRDSEARFRHQATHDALTGLPNRALFTERLAGLFQHPVRPGHRLGLCFIDLDGFKIVNDTLGHHVGDTVLVAVADRVRGAADLSASGRPLVARLGGDEFVLLFTGTAGPDDMVKIVEAALAAIAEPIRADGREVHVSASVGIVERAVAGSSPHDVMRAADVTLHWAKAAGKNRWALFDAERNAREMARHELSAAMPAALRSGEFFLEYQPLTCLATGVVVGAEALVRWRHPHLGLLRPDHFIDLAEESGLIVALGARLLADACGQARLWHDRSPDCPFVSVNLAVRQVHDPHLVRVVGEVLDRTGLPPHKVQLEITESALLGNAAEPIQALRTLADRGVRIAIDDFGTGYSNLAYLRQLPVCELKVASSFVAGLGRPSTGSGPDPDERIVEALVSLAHALGLTVTAEGVETAAQARCLRAMGCDAAQGWYYGRPGPSAAILAALER